MTTAHFDKECLELRNTLDLKLNSTYGAVWFCIEEKKDFSTFIKSIFLIFNSLNPYFWFASSGGTGSKKILEIKRAFGSWSIPKKDIASRFDIEDLDGEKLYSDVASINNQNIDLFSKLFERQLLGIDSTLFLLPVEYEFQANNGILSSLEKLLIMRNELQEINEQLQNNHLVEEYVETISGMAGIATLILRDSDMKAFIVAIGNQFSMKSKWENVKKTSIEIIEKREFLNQIEAGVSLAALS